MRKREPKQKEHLKRKGLVYVFGVLIVLATVAMFELFIFSSNKIHEMVLDQEMEQNKVVASYITRILNSEMEDCLEILKTSETFLSDYKKDSIEDVVDSLLKIKNGTVFEFYGIMDLEGNSLNDCGERHKIYIPQLLEAIKANKSYISDVQTKPEEADASGEETEKPKEGWLILAVPLHENGKIIGAVWGSYPISALAKKVEKTGDTQRYFQIIDNEGNYISRSSSEKSFAQSLPLWEEMERYEFPNGENARWLQKEVEQHRSGTFFFTFKGQKRYVAYEPLGINNWYVFSVLVGETIDSYVKNIRGISTTLMFGFAAFITVLFGILFLLGNWSRRIMEQKNHQLEITMRLFQMTMRKTNDIPFEIARQKRQVKFYRSKNDEEEIFYELEDVSPEKLVEAGWIHKKDQERYEAFYEDVFNGSIEKKEDKTLVIEVNFQGQWSWKKAHLLTVDQESMIGFLEDYNEQISRNKELEEAKQRTKYDALTGLYNRATFVQKVNSLLQQKQADKEQRNFALFLLDLDHFKEINDTFGHIAGDQVLCDVAKSLKSVLRKSDLTGRLGGDEFVVFLSDFSDEKTLPICARKINEALVKTYEKDDQRVQISASIGIAQAEEGNSFGELYERADAALYEVKRQNRNGYAIWHM